MHLFLSYFLNKLYNLFVFFDIILPTVPLCATALHPCVLAAKVFCVSSTTFHMKCAKLHTPPVQETSRQKYFECFISSQTSQRVGVAVGVAVEMEKSNCPGLVVN